ncbi:MAG: L-rhamnose mutarotase [Actinomycetota bacterium]
MLRNAFTMKLRPGAFAEYKRLHDELWPELFAEIENSGIASMSIVAINEEYLVLYSEIRDDEAWTKLRDSEVHQRWTDTLRPLFVLNEEGAPDVHDLPEIFHIRTSVTDEAL